MIAHHLEFNDIWGYIDTRDNISPSSDGFCDGSSSIPALTIEVLQEHVQPASHVLGCDREFLLLRAHALTARKWRVHAYRMGKGPLGCSWWPSLAIRWYWGKLLVT